AETVSAAREAASVLEIDVTDGVVSPAPVDVPSFSIGDVPSDSAHRVCVTVRAASVDAAPLEPLAAVAVPVTPESLIVYSGSQDPFAERRRLEGYLGCAVQVESLPTGGSFGARGASIVSGLAALMAYTLERPAKLTLTHEDSERLLPAQPAMTATVTLSADADGQLSGVEADLQTDLGAYCDQGPTLLARALRLAAGPYAAPAVHATATATLTHRPPTGPGRGLWMAPLAFALEQAMDRLAETIAVDPMTLRRQNLDRPTVDGPVLDALRETYDEARASGQAVGLACARQVLGLGGAEQATVAFALRPGGEVRIHTGFAESGQGFRALAIDRAASITGAPRSVFTLQTDTALDVDSGPTIAGRDVWLGLAAIEDAARKMKTAPTLWVGDVLMGQATSDTEAVVFGFCAQLARLDADGTLQEVVVAVDVGDDVDAVITRGQIEGAVHMGMGIAVSEQKSTSDAGVPETQYRKLGPLKAKFSPSISSIAIGSSGVRPIGDVAVLATAPAIASALRLAGETPEDTLPMQRNPVARAMGVKPPRKRNRRR
ncbi:MAG: molybdopterin cofactor-binding domain-containing protein, partial [Myxococcota bacterium]